MEGEGSQFLPQQPSTLAQCKVLRDVPGMGSHVSPVCGHLHVRVMSWVIGTGEVCGRAWGVSGAVWLWVYFQQAQQDVGTLRIWCFGEGDPGLSLTGTCWSFICTLQLHFHGVTLHLAHPLAASS